MPCPKDVVCDFFMNKSKTALAGGPGKLETAVVGKHEGGWNAIISIISGLQSPKSYVMGWSLQPVLAERFRVQS